MSTLDDKKRALDYFGAPDTTSELFRLAADALRREIAAEEAALPKSVIRATLSEIECCLRKHARRVETKGYECHDASCSVLGLDIQLLFSRARVLRDEIVPWLKACSTYNFKADCDGFLRKLGEEG